MPRCTRNSELQDEYRQRIYKIYAKITVYASGMTMKNKQFIVFITFALFLAMIPAANYTLLHFGSSCPENQPCVIPVWFYPVVYAPSGVLFAGAAFVLRDILQRLSSLWLSLFAVLCGTIISYKYVNADLAVAGSAAYFLSELTDTYVYTYLQRYSLILAVFISACAGLIVDSMVFLHMAFHSYQFLPGQIIGKLLVVILCLPVIKLSRRLIRSF
ncbi:MAG: beta-carotene 15,15-monooxygenase [Burkholderiales bacterium]|nr:beta-carotene 15,15-monooxygenase [Burkholderiales bacterium]